MKGFTRDNKFIPMTDYKKVTRKSREQKAETKGVRLKRNKKFEEHKQERIKILKAHDKKFPPFHIGDTVETPLGVGRITFIIDNIDEKPPFDEPKYKVTFADNQKFVNHSSIKKIRKKRDEQVITIDGHSTILPADPNSSEDEDRHAEQTVRIGLVKRRQALALIKKSSPKGISDWEIREILGSEALPEIRVLSGIDKTVVEKDGIFKVAKK